MYNVHAYRLLQVQFILQLSENAFTYRDSTYVPKLNEFLFVIYLNTNL